MEVLWQLQVTAEKQTNQTKLKISNTVADGGGSSIGVGARSTLGRQDNLLENI